jgi:hypothetical protein
VRKIVALAALVALQPSCEPFPEDDRQFEGAREAFERWKEAMIAGRVSDCVQLTTLSLRSQWLYDRLAEGDRAALEWKARMDGGARPDLDLWFSEAGKDTSRGRVTTLPARVLADPSLMALLVGYLRDAQRDVAQDFKTQKVIQLSADDRGVSILVRSQRNEPEIYQLVSEEGFWKVDGHRKRAPR